MKKILFIFIFLMMSCHCFSSNNLMLDFEDGGVSRFIGNVVNTVNGETGDVTIDSGTLTGVALLADHNIFTTTNTFNGFVEIDNSLLVGAGTLDTTSNSQLIIKGEDDQASGSRTCMTFGNGGFNVPSDVEIQSNGDKWVFWNKDYYKASLGFNLREMWFQSTSANDGATNKFRFYGGQVGSPVEILQFGTGDNGYIWNDAGIDLDYRLEGDNDDHLLFVNGGTDQVIIGTNTATEKLEVYNGNIKTNQGIIAATGMFSGNVFENNYILDVVKQNIALNFLDNKPDLEHLLTEKISDTVLNTNSNDYLASAALKNGKFAVVLGDGGDGGKGVLLIISNDGIITSTTTFTSGLMLYPTITTISNGDILIAYSDGGNSFYGTFVIYDEDGNLVKAPFVFNSYNSSRIYSTTLMNDYVILSYTSSGESNKVKFNVYDSINDTIITSSFIDDLEGSYAACGTLANNNFIVTFRGSGSAGSYAIFDKNGIEIKAVAVFNAQSTFYNWLIPLKNGNIMLAFLDVDTGKFIILDKDGNIIKAETIFAAADARFVTGGKLSNDNVVLSFHDFDDSNIGKYVEVTQNGVLLHSIVNFTSGDSEFAYTVAGTDYHTFTIFRDDADSAKIKFTIYNMNELESSGIHAKDANGLKLYNNGGVGIFINDAGNVGIGTANIGATLDIVKSGYGVTLRVKNTDIGGVSGASLILDAAGVGAESNVQFKNGSTANIWKIGMDNQPGGASSSFAIRYGNNTTPMFVVDISSNIGIGGISPETLLEMTSEEPYITLHNSTNEDTDYGRESRIIFKGEQSGGEETTLGILQFSHEGTGDDQKGRSDIYLNYGSDGDAPKLAASLWTSETNILNLALTNGLGDDFTFAVADHFYIGGKTVSLGDNLIIIKNHPVLEIYNSTQEDGDETRESYIHFRARKTGESPIFFQARIKATHHGTGTDEKGNLIFEVNAGDDLTTPTEVMRLNSSGFVGIGTTTPTVELDVLGDVNVAYGITTATLTVSGITYKSYFYASITSTATTNITQDVYIPIAGTYIEILDGLGDWTISGSSMTYTGTTTRIFKISVASCADSSAATLASIAIAKNNVVDTGSDIHFTMVNNEHKSMVTNNLISIAQGDIITIQVTTDDGDDLTIDHLSLVITQLN